MAQQGWYPDPAGQSGMFRYWDGQTWSETTSPTPLPGPPGQPYGLVSGQANPATYGSQQTYGHSTNSQPSGGFDPTQPLATGQYSSHYQPLNPTSGAYQHYQQLEQTKRRPPVTMVVTLCVGLVVLALLVYAIVRAISGVVIPGQTDDPAGNTTESICPTQPDANQRYEHPVDDRVYGGMLSYPKLGSPWSTVLESDVRIPFGRDVAEQAIVIHPEYDDLSSWVISVMVGELYAGDGFYAPQEASEIVNRCIFGAFYGDTALTADTLRSEAYSIDGYDGWITETNLSFSIPNLPTTSELAIVIIVQTSELSSSIFYASIPNDAVQYQADVEAAIAGLKVTT